MKIGGVRFYLLICLVAGSVSCGGGGGSSSGTSNSGSNAGAITTSPAGAQLEITTASILPPTLQGHPYTATLTATNGQGALHWTIARISPNALFVDGLAIDPNTGVLSGTPTFTGTGGFTATVTDSASPVHTASANFTVTTFPPLASGQAQSATVVEYQTALNVASGITGGVPPLGFSVTSGTLPPGLKFDSTGALTGAAYTTGTYQFTITAQDSFSPPETATQSLSITVVPPFLFVANSLPARALINRPFTGRVVALGGVPPYKFSPAALTSLPPGLSLDASTGMITGTPTTAGTYLFAIQATDSNSTPQSAMGSFNFTVGQPIGRNDTPASATLIGNGSYSASISPYIDPPNGAPFAADNDYYKVVSAGAATVHVETNAKRINPNNPLDTVIEIVDGNGVRMNTCRQPGDTSTAFASPCINDDIAESPHVQDSALDYQVPGAATTSTTFYIHVFDWRGDARPDMTYLLDVSGAVAPPH